MLKASRYLAFLPLLMACQSPPTMQMEIYTSNAQGALLQKSEEVVAPQNPQWSVQIDTAQVLQEWEGFGGAITESSAHLLQHLSPAKREEILQAYFASDSSAYNLVRLHMNSCDFSLSHYAYVEEGDTSLETFDLAPDRDDVIPIARRAKEIAGEDLWFFASPWTAPAWMKDNQAWKGGKLLPEYRPVWAQYFVKYAQAMQAEGIDLWGFTVENEPLGNDANWESMHFSPEEMGEFVKQHLAPALQQAQLNTQLLVYDQNRGEELIEWSEVLLKDEELLPSIYGTAVHWYTSTFKWFPESLQATHKIAPNKVIWNTEACVDAEVPVWQDDAWYWKKEATDWGYTWAKEEDKPDHPKYAPVYRYARDIIGCMNNWVSAWVDWNIVLDKGGGPNHAQNWCIAPVIVDTTSDEVYYTPLYYTLRHFSQFIQRGAKVYSHQAKLPEGVHLAVAQNPTGEWVVPVINTSEEPADFKISWGSEEKAISLPPQTFLTILFKHQNTEHDQD